ATSAPATSTGKPAAAAAQSVSVSAKSSAPAPPVSIKQASAETNTVIENDLYKITFTNKGAQVTSWILKKHQDENGHPLDLVNPRGATAFGYPLSLFTYDQALRTKLNSALFVASNTTYLKAPATITFDYSDADVTVRKSFTFDHSYVVKVETSVQQHGAEVAAFPQWPSGFGDQISAPSWASEHIDYFEGSKVERHAAKEGSMFSFLVGGRKSLSNGNTVNGPFHWAGAVDQYFGAIFLPDDPAN